MSFDLQGIGQDDLNDLLTECYRDTGMFAKVFMPDRFNAEFSPIHRTIIDLLDSNEKKVAIAAPRGIGKTSLCIAYVAKRILYRSVNFVPYIGQSQAVAMMQTENLKRELISNSDVRKIFGSIRTSGAKDLNVDETFSKMSWVAKLDEDHKGCFVLPRGGGQQIRGILFRDKRPDLFIVDDFEDADLIKNEEIRTKWKTWFAADVEKAVSRVSNDWRIIYIDTLKHEDALIQDLLDAPDWTGVRLELCDDQLRSNAPTMISDEEIKLEYEAHKKRGQLDVFSREYRNIPVDEESKSFKAEYFRSYEEDNLRAIIGGSTDKLQNVVLVDPAKTASMHSADSAVVGVGINREGQSIFVRDIVSGKFYPDQLYKEMFSMVTRLRARILAVEVTGLEEFIKQPIKNTGRLLGVIPVYRWLKARRSKEERVASLVPYYRGGHIYHNSSCCLKLEQQLSNFPRSKLWDVMDCFAYVIEVMEMDSFYFEPYDDDGFDDELVYDELENEPVISGWEVY